MSLFTGDAAQLKLTRTAREAHDNGVTYLGDAPTTIDQ